MPSLSDYTGVANATVRSPNQAGKGIIMDTSTHRYRRTALLGATILIAGLTLVPSAWASDAAHQALSAGQTPAQVVAGPPCFGAAPTRPPGTNGSNSPDVINGTNGPDNITGFNGNDLICGLDGNDTLSGGGGDDLIRGNLGNDVLFGDEGNDRLLGDQGNDRLFGDQGNDILRGDAGFDRCDGGPGNDTAVDCEVVVNVP